MTIILAIGLVASVALPAFGADFSNDRLLVTGSDGKLFDFSGNTLGTTGGGLRGSAYIRSTDQYAIFNSDDANTNLYSCDSTLIASNNLNVQRMEHRDGIIYLPSRNLHNVQQSTLADRLHAM